MPDTDEKEEPFVLAEDVENIAKNLIPNFHPDLATARMHYVFTAKASKKAGRELAGKVSKVSGKWQFLTDLDYLVEVARPVWSTMDSDQKVALVDHLLEHCQAVEDEQTGDMSWKIREPEVREFSTILQRRGAWNETLVGFVAVAQNLDISTMIDEEMEGVAQEEDLTLSEEEG